MVTNNLEGTFPNLAVSYFESTKNAHYMCQISSQLDEWCQK